MRIIMLGLGALALPVPAPVTALADPVPAAPGANPLIDYQGFATLTKKVAPYRATRLLSLARFSARRQEAGVLLLDARSADAYRAGHIRGAVNLPFTDFTAASLAAVIGADRNRPILIYCNNNFRNDVQPIMIKARPLALNIQTFINLVGYGYANVWELGEAVDVHDTTVEWVTS